MRVLIYKRTHTGDPDANGVFGVHDCMGRVRALKYDVVIGVGGVGSEPRREGIANKITWIRVTPNYGEIYRRGPLVTFRHFLLFDENGPEFGSWAKETAAQFYSNRVRYVIKDLSETNNLELHSIVSWAIKNGEASTGISQRKYKGMKVRCINRMDTTKEQLAC